MGSGPPALFGPQGSEVAAATLPEAGTSEGGRFATGIEMADLLDQASSRPGAEGLRLLAACWRIGAESGGTFASVVDGLAMALRDEEAHREEVAAQLAGPRATARLLAGLPLLGLAMAAALGAHPVTFLLSTWPGICCLILGAVLDVAGLAWTRRIAESAECPG
jgi:tight adherence protein B